jgi:UDP-N-acetylglucosamine diphosphorylase / glucose-1-phosphate thymidylyltransferase / UDP-N-acetylgalactosamine diphosphorylase / glucosamine-1-phosphate N-acetyltransferase / galactosamine-1-phosphate N-acetyltransferase
VVVVDDHRARAFAPFASTRPWGAMVAGALTLGERWTWAFPEHEVRLCGAPHLFDLEDAGGAPVHRGVVPAGTIVANARAAVALERARPGSAWTVDGRIAAVRLTADTDAAALHEWLSAVSDQPAVPNAIAVHGWWLDAPWHLLTHLQAMLADDLSRLATTLERGRDVAAPVLGVHPVVIEPGAVVEPFVVFDASMGPVVVRRGAQIAAFTRLAGPCYVAQDAHLLGGRIAGSVIGPQCRIHGDVSASIFAGQANKAHEGFVGHSVVGRWANLGAGTTTSNLKNSYGSVHMWTPDGEVDSGLTFLGALIGEHAKLGIGTMLATGTIVGAGANLFGTGRPPKRVPPFVWGDTPPFTTFTREKFIAVAARVMARRGVAVPPSLQAALGRIHDAALAEEA